MGGFDKQAAAALHAAPSAPDWLEGARASARAQWLAAEWPTRKTEAWKYTSLEALETAHWLREPPPATGPVAALPLDGLDEDLVVFRNGRFDHGLSRVAAGQGITVCSFAEASGAARELLATRLGTVAGEGRGPFAALAGCWTRDGVLIHLARGAHAARPLRVLHLAGPEAAGCAWSQRLLLVAEPDSAIELVEHFAPGAEGFVSGLTEIALERGARLRHHRLQLERAGAVHLGGLHVELHAAASYTGFLFASGARLKRVDLRVRHRGPGAEALLNGVYLARGTELVDVHSSVEHEEPHCTTRQVYRGLVDDEARAVFNGRILIRPGAQKTAADLSNRNLLFSNRAEVDTKPELEIYADDVKCSHGATVSRIDGKSLYYLRSRGISRADAEVLLAAGFVNELLATVELPAVESLLAAELRGWFGARAPEALP